MYKIKHIYTSMSRTPVNLVMRDSKIVYTSPKTITPVVIIEQIASTKILIPYLLTFITDMSYYTIVCQLKSTNVFITI